MDRNWIIICAVEDASLQQITIIESAMAQVVEKTIRGILSSQARFCVQPKKKSEMIATGGEGSDLNRSSKGS